MQDVLPGVILAGGFSRRMGSPKALLTDGDGRSFVVRIVASLIEAGLSEVVIVTGDDHDAIAAALISSGLTTVPKVIRNPSPARGQLSSLWTGMDEVCRPDTAAMLVTLVDVPMVSPVTIRAVIDGWRRSRAPIVRPLARGRRGHPVIFDRVVFDELRGASLEEGARAVVRAHTHDSLDVPVDDEGCIADVDTPADYRALLEKPKPAR
jgi:molybdenum cofactor cytidylyltransferase